jgi:hypothetical protein
VYMKPKTTHCHNCGKQKNKKELKNDFVDFSRLLCHDCYYLRECSNCTRDLPIDYLVQDDFLPQLLCKDCYYYEIMMCERCEKMVYEYNMFEQTEGEMFCVKCDHYGRIAEKQN